MHKSTRVGGGMKGKQEHQRRYHTASTQNAATASSQTAGVAARALCEAGAGAAPGVGAEPEEATSGTVLAPAPPSTV